MRKGNISHHSASLQPHMHFKRWRKELLIYPIFVLSLCSLATGRSPAQLRSNDKTTSSAASDETPQPASDKSTAKGHKKRTQDARGALVGAPIPVSSPAIGSGVALLVGYIFPLRKKDTISPPSVLGAGGLITNNSSHGFVVGAELYFNENRYHVLSGYAQADLKYSFYGTGNAAGDAGIKFGLDQTLNAFFAEGTRRVFWHLFVGPRVLLATSTLAPQHFGEQHPGLPPFGINFNLRALGFKIERDTTANHFYPISGTSGQLAVNFFDEVLGSTFTFQSYRLTFNAYHSLTKNQVLAYNAYICMTGGNAPFFGKCIFGTSNELRGYPAGRYIDRDMVATQIEYRLTLPLRFGVVAFAGLGEVGPRFGAFNYDNLLPSIGFGPRFRLSTKYHVNLRADLAQGKNGRTFSMGLGEAF